jgi:hypothetical protein
MSTLDHLVLNARFETDAAEALFSALGFTLTPRGHHSLGSINHLVVFEEAYLELVGLPLGIDTLRKELLESPVGIDGLVLATRDADASRDAMLNAGLAMQPVQSFSRPLTLEGIEREARFRAARLAAGQFAAGRVYFCEHGTPELIWRREWMSHPNGVTGLAGLVVVGPDPQALAERYAALGPMTPDFALSFATREGFAGRCGALAAHAPARDDFFGAITLRANDPAELARRARRLGLPQQETENGVAIALPAFAALLEFTR